MNILSIDIATKTGYAILKDNAITKYGTIRFSVSQREKDFYKWLIKIIKEEDITQIVAEDCFIDEQRPTIGCTLSRLHGIMYLVAQQKRMSEPKIYEAIKYKRIMQVKRPPQISKKQYRQMLKERTMNFVKNKGYDIKTDDEADAITLLMYYAKIGQIQIKPINIK